MKNFRKIKVYSGLLLAIAGSSSAIAADVTTDTVNIVKKGNGATIAIGNDASSRRMNGIDSISIGSGSAIGYGDNSIAMGTGSKTKGTGAIAIGNSANASGSGSIVVGDGAKSTGPGVVIGKGASQGEWRAKYPNESTGAVLNTVSVGDKSAAKGVASVAIGPSASTGRDGYGSALGNSAKAEGKSSTAIGASSVSKSWGSVALGLNSVAERAAGSHGYVPDAENSEAEKFVKSKMSDVQRARLAEIDSQIAEYKKTVDPLAKAYFSSLNEYDSKVKAINDSDLDSKAAYAEKQKLNALYKEVVANSSAYNGSKELAAMNALKAERSDMFATYIATHGAVSVGSEADSESGKHAVTRQVTNLAAGTKDTDAVNVAQLKDLQSVSDKANRIQDEKIAEEKHERIKGDESTLNAAKSFTSSREVVINNRTDRVVAEAGNKVLQKANNYTDWRVNGLEQSMTNYTNERFAQLKNEVDRNKKRADAGIAGAMAMTAIPQVPMKTVSFGMAMAGYRSEGAVAAGVHINTSENSAVKVNAAWDSQSGVGVSAGMALGW
ncbi:hypothetical protein IM098_003016 [Escherichia coli]|uniref:YadA-like family protein n=1 Tax=Enterobacteriaceae TaxID=543 RepID=UPI00098CA8E6|nr:MULTISPECIES: YadA-like family protein [Enterobacteriaceae]ASL30414.1 hypothetical protein CEJ55_06975 [Escherichia coli]EEY3894909.1 hypothetical protein [Escherichia coli]EFB1461946.1 hypothetical protein [Escherichia coli]EFC1584813.1 hypothetical protein [Escherichia coli]EFE9640367.1 hypothetical protein [Escherichia coli]